MFALTNRPEMGARLYSGLVSMATHPEKGVDVMKLIQHMAGVMVETCLVFDEPDEALHAGFEKLMRLLGCGPAAGQLGSDVLPPAHILDFETERGRAAARTFFEEWLDDAHEFHNLFTVIVHNVIVSWERDGQPRAESLRLLVECAQACMAFELAAQELCDVVIEEKIGAEGWSLADCIASLSAAAGRRLALFMSGDNTCEVFLGASLSENLDSIVHVMMQEAIRSGVPAGSNWRFGLPANDVPVSAPYDLIFAVEPACRDLFEVIGLTGPYEQAAACAKAAGRMLAVAAGGEAPGMEPAIAKPLAMAAITDTYKSVCMRQRALG
ncbi:MAG: hypothetical protein IT558_02675 [Alphaproteobacteria bacterium]|nr:hypothetical protein [Alphaproteobacteria bacterium]